jgi:hypothetical protein
MTDGKIPTLGFDAAVIGYVALLGFSPNDVAVAAPPGMRRAVEAL